MINGKEVLSFRYSPILSDYNISVSFTIVFLRRGDNVNGLDPNDRTPDPERLLRFVGAAFVIINYVAHNQLAFCLCSAYFHSTTTLNYIRGLLTSGFASLHHPRDWSLAHVRSPALRYVCDGIEISIIPGAHMPIARNLSTSQKASLMRLISLGRSVLHER